MELSAVQSQASKRRRATKFHTTLLQSGKTAVGIQVPNEVVEALGAGKRPPVRVTINRNSSATPPPSWAGCLWWRQRREPRERPRGWCDRIDADIELETDPREGSSRPISAKRSTTRPTPGPFSPRCTTADCKP